MDNLTVLVQPQMLLKVVKAFQVVMPHVSVHFSMILILIFLKFFFYIYIFFYYDYILIIYCFSFSSNIQNHIGSWAGLAYLALYLAGKLKSFNGKSHLWRYWLSLAPLALALFITMTRLSDYWHHWQDVIVGSLIGMFSF